MFERPFVPSRLSKRNKRTDGKRHEILPHFTKGMIPINYQSVSFVRTVCRDVSLGDVVASHFGGIQNTGTHDIGFNSTIESGNSLLFVHAGDQGHQRNCLFLVGLSKSLQDIKRILPEVVAGMLGNDSVFHHNDMCHDLMYRECISKTRQRPTQLKDFVSLVHVQSLRSRSAHRSYLGKH